MFLRSIVKKARGKTFRYWCLVESVRTAKGPRQRVVAHLGDLSRYTTDDWQQLAARMGTPEIAARLERQVHAGGRRGRPANWTFGDREPGGEEMAIKRDSVRLREVRGFGEVYVALQLWKQLGLGTLFDDLLGSRRTKAPLPLVAAALAVNRLTHPDSELGLVRWYEQTALPALLGIPRLTVATLYRTLDAVIPHQEKIEAHLAARGATLFGREYSYLVYDLTSIYFEGRAVGNDQAQRGYSRDHRPDCLQVCIGLVVDRSGFPVGYEVWAGKTRDAKTVPSMLDRLERRFGPPTAERLLCLDRGMISDVSLGELRGRGYRYILADRRAESQRWLEKVETSAWEVIRRDRADRELVAVQVVGDDDGDRIILVRSAGCGAKERSIHDRRLGKLTAALTKLQTRVARGRLRQATKIERAIGAVLARHPGINRWVEVHYEPSSRTVSWQPRPEVADAAREREGIYTLRTNQRELSPTAVWQSYIQLVTVENVFRSLKSDLKIRPIFHRKTARVKAHILFSVLAYALWWTLEHLHRQKGGLLSGRRLLEYLQGIKLGTVSLLTSTGLRLNLQRICDPSREQQEILATLGIALPRLGRQNLEAISLRL